MTKRMVLLVAVFLVLGWLVDAQTAAGDKILEFETMIGVQGPFLGPANSIRGVPGAGAPWTFAQGGGAKGELSTNGELEVRVKGLVLAAGPSAGANPVANFRAIVSCQSIDSVGNPSIVNLSTGSFPATTTGDSEIEATVEFPNGCFAPIIFVTNPTGRWFAVTGR